MQASQKLVDFIAAEEGVVTRAYRDPVGILTIGIGHTTAAGGLVVNAGMTITRKQAFDLLREDLRKFMKRCDTAMPGGKKYEIEGATSFDFNTGAIHRASWVKHWKAENANEARRRLLLWNKAGGKRLRGLAARRAREADIIFLNKWPESGREDPPTSPSRQNEYEGFLGSLGYLNTDEPFDRADVHDAVKSFQRDKGLVVDGIIGPATRATLQRVLAAKRVNQASAAAGAASGGSALPLDAVNSTTALAIVAGVIAAGILFGWAYRNRGRLFGIRVKITDGAA